MTDDGQEDREGGQDGGIGYEDWESENDDEVCVKSLFDDTTFGSIAALLEHDERVHGFRLQDAAALVGTDDLHLIMLVNLIRQRVRDAGSTSPVDASFIAGLQQEIASRAFLSELDTYMLPVLPEDPLLYLLRDALGGLGDDDDDEGPQSSYHSARQSDDALHAPLALDEYQDDMRQQVESYRSLLSALSLGGDVSSGGGGSSSTSGGGGGGGGSDSDGYYFDSYAHIGIHETMLRDRPRTSAYAAALAGMNLRGKVVLDVGCGTGILCMLAARAGAKKVIGVDFSGILDVSRRVIAANGFGDVVTLVRGRVEEIDLGPDLDEVDVIVSEWMGYGLYYENMLASVIHARKEFLAPTGVMLPSHALLYVEALGAQGAADRVSWWGDVYGFDMTLCAPGVTTEAQVSRAASALFCCVISFAQPRRSFYWAPTIAYLRLRPPISISISISTPPLPPFSRTIPTSTFRFSSLLPLMSYPPEA